MIRHIENIPGNIIAFRYEGEVTAADYESVVFPALAAEFKNKRKFKVLLQLADNFEGFNFGALKDDMEVGLKYFANWEKIAFVSEKEWLNHTVKAFGFLIPAQLHSYKNDQIPDAIKWLSE
jgi:hypothetical protein